jgi:hypothetical protein
VRPHQRLLRRVRRVVGVPQDEVSRPESRVFMTSHQLLISGQVAALGPLNQARFVQRRPPP